MLNSLEIFAKGAGREDFEIPLKELHKVLDEPSFTDQLLLTRFCEAFSKVEREAIFNAIFATMT